jgi:hypothetical protein
MIHSNRIRFRVDLRDVPTEKPARRPRNAIELHHLFAEKRPDRERFAFDNVIWGYIREGIPNG